MRIPKTTMPDLMVVSRGRCARISGLKRDDNPYRQDTMTKLYLLWLKGWEAENERQRNLSYARAS